MRSRKPNPSKRAPVQRKPDQRPRRDERAPSGRGGSEAPRENAVFGLLPVTEALRSGTRRVEKVLIAEGAGEKRISEIIELSRSAGVHFQRVPREQLVRLTGPDANHQGVVAIVSAAEYADAEEVLDRVAASESPLVLVLDGIEDPRNLGALLRVAECAGVDGVFLPEHRAVGLTDTVVKTSAGAVEYVDVAKVKNLNRLIERLKEMNIWVVGTSGEAGTSYTEWDWNRPTALVMGSEGSGLHRLVAENCDALVKIPMKGKIESLNVSVAAGVVLFEVLRQREAKRAADED